MKAWTIVGYTFRAENICANCVLHAVAEHRPDATSPGLFGLEPEHGLDQVAEWLGIEREDERTFDSDDFPKVIFASQVEDDEHCPKCHELIG